MKKVMVVELRMSHTGKERVRVTTLYNLRSYIVSYAVSEILEEHRTGIQHMPTSSYEQESTAVLWNQWVQTENFRQISQT